MSESNSQVTEPESLVSIRNVHFSRGERKILDGIDIEIPKGKVTTIMGPSGCGKTRVR